jgi:DNA modification methylase
MARSLARRGQINPLLTTRDLVLINGERSFRGAKQLGWTHINIQYQDEADELTLLALELEENVKRKEMEWSEERTWLVEFHERCCANDPTWNQTKTADEIGMSQQWVSEHLVVHEEGKFDPEIYNEPVFSTALRKAIVNGERRAKAEGVSIGEPMKLKEVYHGDFCKWVETYKGPPFNFIHCDFPYGIGTDKRQQGNIIAALGGYDDSRETNLTLLKVLCDNLGRICDPSAHIMFWFSMRYYHETLEFFREHSDFKIDPFPLIWMKVPNAGLVPDAKRQPRRIYETCFYGSRGDHKILTPVANAYAGPIDGSGHPSVKPEKMLSHFFEMFVDVNTRMLDPTCGSGTSLRAAEYHDATQILGIEINEDYAQRASDALHEARRMKRDKDAGLIDTRV